MNLFVLSSFFRCFSIVEEVSEGVRNEISFEENEIEDRFMFRWKSRVIGGVY